MKRRVIGQSEKPSHACPQRWRTEISSSHEASQARARARARGRACTAQARGRETDTITYHTSTSNLRYGPRISSSLTAAAVAVLLQLLLL